MTKGIPYNEAVVGSLLRAETALYAVILLLW